MKHLALIIPSHIHFCAHRWKFIAINSSPSQGRKNCYQVSSKFKIKTNLHSQNYYLGSLLFLKLQQYVIWYKVCVHGLSFLHFYIQLLPFSYFNILPSPDKAWFLISTISFLFLLHWSSITFIQKIFSEQTKLKITLPILPIFQVHY